MEVFVASPTQAFFNDYADAYDRRDSEDVSEAYFIPTVIMNDDSKKVYTKRDHLVEHIDDILSKLDKAKVSYTTPEVCQTMRLSESIMFANVKWTFNDVNEQKLFTCFVSYTLQTEADSLKIIVSVIDDEERELAKHF